MAKGPRVLIDNACYPLRVRGNQKQNVFLCNADKERYLAIVKKAKRKYKIALYAYCLMTNHIHFLVQALCAKNISKFMHWINRGYATYFNEKYEKCGHVWQGRFKSNPILMGRYLINVATYIENNPVRAELVQDLADYVWSSYRERCLFKEKWLLDDMDVECSFVEEGHLQS